MGPSNLVDTLRPTAPKSRGAETFPLVRRSGNLGQDPRTRVAVDSNNMSLSIEE